MVKKNILFIVGSLRRKSFNRQLATRIAELLGEQADISFLEYADLPYMNQDMEFPPPDGVSRVRKQIAKADGIWIVTPEYNGNLPGGLKNLLDWLSRALEENNWDSKSIVFEKKVTFSGAGGRAATSGARNQLRELLKYMGMDVMEGFSVGIALKGEEFITNELSLSQEEVEALQSQVNAFFAFIE